MFGITWLWFQHKNTTKYNIPCCNCELQIFWSERFGVGSNVQSKYFIVLTDFHCNACLENTTLFAQKQQKKINAPTL